VDKGIVLNEPSVVAVQDEFNRGGKIIVAVGAEAKNMLGRTPGHITAVRPMKDGVIADFTYTEKMLQYFINKVHGNRFLKPQPARAGVRALRLDAGRAPRDPRIRRGRRRAQCRDRQRADGRGGRRGAAGARSARLDGARHRRRHQRSRRDLAERHRLRANSARIGGDRFDDAIMNYVRRNYGILIGEATAERIKIEIGSAYPGQRCANSRSRAATSPRACRAASR
jgi:rod shape-determining protein MreB